MPVREDKRNPKKPVWRYRFKVAGVRYSGRAPKHDPSKRGAKDAEREHVRLVLHPERVPAPAPPERKVPKLEEYAEGWIAARRARADRARATGTSLEGLRDIDNEESRLEHHVLPTLGRMRLDEVRPRHLIELVTTLRTQLAPRTVLSVYGVVRTLFRDAIIAEIVVASPCVLRGGKGGHLPKIEDKNPEWRRGAQYTREELEQLIGDGRIAFDRRVLYALEGLGALRHGEAAGLRWRNYDTTAEPLGKLSIVASYDGAPKAGAREMPVHPVLAAILAEWRLSGWAALYGRPPGPDDLVVPLPADPPRKQARANPRAGGGMRNKNDSFKRFRTDLAELGLRHRRGHDLRRTLISLARADGALKDVLEHCTHNPKGDTIDLYTSVTWSAKCAEVAKLRVSRAQRGTVLQLRGNGVATVGCDGAVNGV